MEYVTLANGKKIDWDEFSRWSYPKQVRNINPPNLGKDFGAEFSEKMSKIVKESFERGLRRKTRNYGAKNGSSRAVITPLGKFDSLREASLAHGVLPETIRKWINARDDFNYIELKPNHTSSRRRPSRAASKAVVTPYGEFESMVAAAKFEGVRVQTLREWVKSPNRPEYRLVSTT